MGQVEAEMTMWQWIEAFFARYDGKREKLIMREALRDLDDNSWMALRAMSEEFPPSTLPYAERKRRESMLQAVLARMPKKRHGDIEWAHPYSETFALEALRCDREADPGPYRGNASSYEEFRLRPWRVEARRGGCVNRDLSEYARTVRAAYAAWRGAR